MSPKDLIARAMGAGGAAATTTVYPTTGFVQAPVVPSGEQGQSADYYRGGSQSDSLAPRYFDAVDNDKQTASIRVRGIAANAKDEKDLIPAYTKFFLDSVTESHQERVQVVETFGDWYAFFYGARPSTYTFTGTLINGVTNNWVQDFMFMYENFLRGTRCVEANARIVLTYGVRQIQGYILNVSNQTQAQIEGGVPVSFSVLVTQRTYQGLSKDFGLQSGGFGTSMYPALQAAANALAGADGKGTSDPATSGPLNQLSGVADGSLGAASSRFAAF